MLRLSWNGNRGQHQLPPVRTRDQQAQDLQRQGRDVASSQVEWVEIARGGMEGRQEKLLDRCGGGEDQLWESWQAEDLPHQV